jgi:DNA-binding response OmpR family regulator
LLLNVLVVEDDPFVERVVIQCLREEGFASHVVHTGQEALSMSRRLKPDAIILDLGLPDISGLDVFRALHQDPTTNAIPVLVLTGNDKENQELELLMGGVADYMTKPFDVKILSARVRNLVRRNSSNAQDVQVLKRSGVSFDSRNRVVRWGETDRASLSPKEFEILFLLACESPNVVDRSTISTRVWGEPSDMLHPRSIDVHVRQIRVKLGIESPAKIEAVSGKGYRLIFC